MIRLEKTRGKNDKSKISRDMPVPEKSVNESTSRTIELLARLNIYIYIYIYNIYI